MPPGSTISRRRAHRPPVSGLHSTLFERPVGGWGRTWHAAYHRAARGWQQAPAWDVVGRAATRSHAPMRDPLSVRQFRQMDSRRDRTSQVRPRPPAGRRPVTSRVRPSAPSPRRMDRYRDLERRRGLPLPMKLFLAVAILALGASIVWIGSGAVGPFVSSVVAGIGGFVTQVGGVVSSSAPTAAPEVGEPPTIEAPDTPYTNEATTDIIVNVPTAITGIEGYTIRLYVAVADKDPALVTEVGVGELSKLVIPEVELAEGRNDFQATVVGPGGESEPSGVATWVMDNLKPKATIISPKDGARIKKSTATLKGKTQPKAAVRAQNASNGANAEAIAGDDGLWETSIALADGANVITVTVTDLAGNENTNTITLRRGEGKLSVVLIGSRYRFSASKLPKEVTFTVTVTGSDGQRVKGAAALFTVSVPGLEAIISREIQTDGGGVATFTTTIPSGAMPGSGLATVLVDTPADGQGTDRATLTVE